MSIIQKAKFYPDKLLDTKTVENFKARMGLGYKLERRIDHKPKIGMAITAYERPEYLEICLDSLFKTNLHDYDITFLLQDDGSKDPRVAEIINKPRDEKYKIVRYFTPKGPNNAGAAINKAVKKLLEMDNFDIIGWGDADALFNPEWLDQTMKICLWAKEHHKDHILGPFTSFNSSDFLFHRILGTYQSPFGNYVVKRQAGMLNYFYFKADFEKLGFFAENKDDENLMTKKFEQLKVRNFCTETSFIEHIGQSSILNQWRPTPVMNAVHAIQLVQDGWGSIDINKFRIKPKEYYAEIERQYYRESFNITMSNSVPFSEKLLKLFRKVWNKIEERLRVSQGYNHQKKWSSILLRNLNKEFNVQTVIPPTYKFSETLIDIVIPTIERDMEILPHVINSVKENIKNKIDKIYIIAPESEKLRDLASQNKCVFVEENSFLAIKKDSIDYKVNGQDRSGWLFQQLIKLGVSVVTQNQNYLVLDSDTIFIQPHVFLFEDNKFLFDLSDEYHETYFEVFSKLTKLTAISPFSFVSHHMLINKDILNELKKNIEESNGMKWYDAVVKQTDHNDASGFSEYETYGNFVFNKFRQRMVLEYWFNLSLKRSEITNIENLKKKYQKKYRTLSFQYYKK